MDAMTAPLQALQWVGDEDGYLRLLDQTLLPRVVRMLECRALDDVCEAIRALRIRGAPAIGLAAAFGLVLAARAVGTGDPPGLIRGLREAAERLKACRPTAVNLAAAVDRVLSAAAAVWPQGAQAVRAALFREARAVEHEDREACARMAAYGASLLPERGGVLTHCNTGGLATAGCGTALGVVRRAWEEGKRFRVYVDETRPLLQGARLTTLELLRAGLPVTLICDSAAAQVMAEGRVQAVVVGADRITRRGDVANKVGTRGLAFLARAHGIPFYVVAPLATVDPELERGEDIPIEERDPREVTHGLGGPTAPEGVGVYNPAFDVTPAELVDALVTEAGVLRQPLAETLPGAFHSAQSVRS